MARKFDTREAWLLKATEGLTAYMTDKLGTDFKLPEIYISVGFPGGGSPRKRIGECWHTEASSDKKNHVFISPVLSDPIDVLATLLHELVHVWDDGQHGPFVKAIRKLGLEGKPTATIAGDELTELLNQISEALGEYPHAALKLGGKTKVQTTRMLKIECGECGFTVRTTRKWIDELEAEGKDFPCPLDGSEMILP